MSNYEFAKLALEAGLGVFPTDQKKIPLYKDWANKRLPENRLKAISDKEMLAVSISQSDGIIEVIDIDTKYDYAGGIYENFRKAIENLGYGYLLKEFVIQHTRSGGYHFIYKVDEDFEKGSDKLTLLPDSKEYVIETRAKRAYFCIHEVIQGDLLALPTISIVERNKIIEAARGLSVSSEVVYTKSETASGKRSGGEPLSGSSPLDLYNADIDFLGLLEGYGWSIHHTRDNEVHLTRPDKDISDGESATLYLDSGILRNFSPNSGLRTDKGISAAEFLAYMEFGGSFSDLTLDLYQKGYGEKKIIPLMSELTKKQKEAGYKPTEESSEEVEPEAVPRFEERHFLGASPLIQKIVRLAETPLEKEVAFLSANTAISILLEGVHFLYGGDEIGAGQFTYFLGPAGSGKGPMARIRRSLEVVDEWYKEDAKEDVELGEDGVTVEDNTEDDELLSLILPGDISSAAIIESLDANNGRGILFETEADPLTNAANQEWGAGITVTIRKAFHHESITTRRKTGKKLYEVDEPHMAILLSSTVDQFRRFIRSHENGTFSRMTYYFIPRVAAFDNPQKKINYREAYKAIGSDLLKIFQKLRGTHMEVRADFEWGPMIQKWGQSHKDILYDEEGEGLDAVVHRFGIKIIRDAMIRCVTREYDIHSNSFSCPSFIFEMTKEDLRYALELADVKLHHSVEAYRRFSTLRDKMETDEYILKLMKAGVSNRKIASEVHKSKATVQQIREAFEKLKLL